MFTTWSKNGRCSSLNKNLGLSPLCFVPHLWHLLHVLFWEKCSSILRWGGTCQRWEKEWNLLLELHSAQLDLIHVPSEEHSVVECPEELVVVVQPGPVRRVHGVRIHNPVGHVVLHELRICWCLRNNSYDMNMVFRHRNQRNLFWGPQMWIDNTAMLGPNPHRTRDVRRAQIQMFFLWCCLRAVWTPPFACIALRIVGTCNGVRRLRFENNWNSLLGAAQNTTRFVLIQWSIKACTNCCTYCGPLIFSTKPSHTNGSKISEQILGNCSQSALSVTHCSQITDKPTRK